MTDGGADSGSHLIMWAMAEANRLRRQTKRAEAKAAHPATTRGGDGAAAPDHAPELGGPVVDWQMPATPGQQTFA